jgi:hypothetical protein
VISAVAGARRRRSRAADPYANTVRLNAVDERELATVGSAP